MLLAMKVAAQEWPTKTGAIEAVRVCGREAKSHTFHIGGRSSLMVVVLGSFLPLLPPFLEEGAVVMVRRDVECAAHHVLTARAFALARWREIMVGDELSCMRAYYEVGTY